MRGRVVHHVYAEDEPTQELGALPPEDEQSRGFGDYSSMQPAWRFSQQSRVVAMALLGAAVAFVAALAIHALHGGPSAVVVGTVTSAAPARSDPSTGSGVPAQLPHRAAAQTRMSVTVRRRARQRIRRSRPPASALTGARRTDGSSSTVPAASVVVARAANSEFNFER
ncbi:MAG TPA: hypothetical protein VIC06_09420 [Solirubrobacteraceae bacterium]